MESLPEADLILRQPDETKISVRIAGEIDVILETLDGYAIVKNPQTGFYDYADTRSDEYLLIPTSIPVGTRDPTTIGLAKNLPHKTKIPEGKFSWQIRRERNKQLSKLSSNRDVLFVKSDYSPKKLFERVGDYVGLCVPVRFPSDPSWLIPPSRETLENYCNLRDHGSANQAAISVFDYFYKNSDGKLRYTNKVADCYTARYPKSHYTDPSQSFTHRAQELVAEAIEHLKDNDYDFRGLALDFRQQIIAISIIYTGEVVNRKNEGLWAHQHRLENRIEVMPEIMPNVFAREYQISAMGDNPTLGTFCHETGHLLCDFPDLYDKGNDSHGAGKFCLMAKGNAPRTPVQVNAYLKYKAGWASRVTEIKGQMNAQIIAGMNDFFIHRHQENAEEYFIIENRRQSGRDSALPGSGLAIWHIDERMNGNDHQGDEARAHYECSLEQADGDFDLEYNINSGEAEDLFRYGVNDRFDDTTAPNSKWWDGTASNLRIENISVAGEIMEFTVST